MIMSHFTALVVFALIVSTVFALITKNEPRDQFRYGLFVFLSFIAVAVVVGWLMYPLPLSGYRP
jgi:galactitol-specific phosphotransferase system IIC component